MNFSPKVSWETLARLGRDVTQRLGAISAGWQVNHDENGAHVRLTWSGDTQTTVGAAGGATALPATPTGYINATLSDGTEIAIPYYAAS